VTTIKKTAFLQILLCLAFFILMIVGVWWLYTYRIPVGVDYRIYQSAVVKAFHFENPYFPYDIGRGFLYHPFALSFVALFFGQTWLWLVASVFAWVLSLSILQKCDFNTSFRSTGLLLVFLMALYGPFIENIYAGQINTFVLLFICLTYYFSERRSDIAGGFTFAAAILLKTSPLILIAYFLALKRWRLLLFTLVGLTTYTAGTALVFGHNVLIYFLETFLKLTTEAARSIYNLSLLSRFGEYAIIVQVILLLVVGYTLFVVYKTPEVRMLAFGIIITVMVIASPIVWYHHFVYLLIPFLALSKVNYPAAIVSIFLIQATRLIQNITEPTLIVILPQVLLLVMLVLYLPPPLKSMRAAVKPIASV
jgi:hypothetical protein